MPPTNITEGLDAARLIRQELPDIGILLLSAHVDVEHAMELLSSGRSIGYLLKSRVADVADFIDTLGQIAKGACVVDPALVQELVSAQRRDDPAFPMPASRNRLWVTEGTVEKHVRSILAKLKRRISQRRR